MHDKHKSEVEHVPSVKVQETWDVNLILGRMTFREMYSKCNFVKFSWIFLVKMRGRRWGGLWQPPGLGSETLEVQRGAAGHGAAGEREAGQDVQAAPEANKLQVDYTVTKVSTIFLLSRDRDSQKQITCNDRRQVNNLHSLSTLKL